MYRRLLCTLSGLFLMAGLMGLSVPELRERARGGDAGAQNNLGLRYEKGQGVRMDQQRALKWLLQSAKQNKPTGQYNAARLLDKMGRDRRSSYWFYQAALRGFDEAQRAFLGRVLNGEGVDRNFIEAYAWTKLVSRMPRISGRPADDFLKRILSRSELEKGRRRAESLRTIIEDDRAEQSMRLPEPDEATRGINFETGTAFYVTPDKLITNAHVVRGCDNIVDLNGQNDLDVLRRYEQYDLALLGGGSGDPLPIEKQSYYDDLRIQTISYPGSNLFSPRHMTRRGKLTFEAEEGGPMPEYWVANFPSREGESGSPAMNTDGEVIGVVFGRITFERKPGAHTGIIPASAIETLLGGIPSYRGDSSKANVIPIICR